MANLANAIDAIPLVADDTERDARFPSPDTNQRIQRVDTGNVEYWNGSAWTTITATVGNLTSLTVAAGSTTDAAIITTTGAINTSHRYDSSNRYDVSVSSAGLVTHDAVGSSAGHQFNDPIALGTVPSASVAVNLQPSTLTGSSQTGLNVQLVASSAVTGNAYAIITQAFSANASYNLGAMYGMYVGTPTLQGAATATNSYGIYVKPQTAGSSHNYGIYVESPSGGSTINTGIKVNGGDIGINVTNAMAGANTTKSGISNNPEFNSSTTASGIAYYAQPTTQATAFTLTNRYAFYADMALKGAGSTITNDFGLYITDVTQGTNNYAIFTGAGQVSFGAPITIRSAAAAVVSSGAISIGSTTQTTVGSAGAASALPATPSGYLKIYLAATQYVIPYYAQA
mgnify:CR=1 FL=1